MSETAKRLVPPTPLSRRLATQSLLFASAEGTFVTGSAFYLKEFVGLTAPQVGLGLTIGMVASLTLAYPMGRIVDLVGPKRMWGLGAIGSALVFGCWPFIGGFWPYVAVVLVFSVIEAAGGAGRNAYILDVMPPKERVETQAYMYSSLNVGFTLGSILSGIALAIPDDRALQWGVPTFSLVVGILNAFWIHRLPKASHDLRRESGEKAVKPTTPGPLRNPGWMVLSMFKGTMWTNQVLLHTVIPLWLVYETDSPRWLLAWLFGTNTVMCIFLPAYTSRGVRNVGDALKRVGWSAGFYVLACAITLITHDTRGLFTIALVWLGHVAVTGAELAISAASWALEAELMDPERRGEYGGVAEVFQGLGSAWAPALFTFLAMQWDPGLFTGVGWFVIAAIVVVAAIGMVPAGHAAARFRDQHFPHAAAEYVPPEAVGKS
ncbi:MFS transporter [Nocardioides sp. GXZ039]|uniref:MFS transporter n=1 Tax=Nocardioides sp. GXZ039 TaxID=3136018 RepID=UPI0030F3FB04